MDPGHPSGVISFRRAGNGMRRRDFITALGGMATAAWPLAARATATVDAGDRMVKHRFGGQLGLVANLNRPGGNLTGVAALNAPVLMKQIELMNELRPNAKPIAVLVDPAIEAADLEDSAKTAAQALGRRVIVIH